MQDKEKEHFTKIFVKDILKQRRKSTATLERKLLSIIKNAGINNAQFFLDACKQEVKSEKELCE